jgi:hypothetical protein
MRPQRSNKLRAQAAKKNTKARVDPGLRVMSNCLSLLSIRPSAAAWQPEEPQRRRASR